MKISENARQWLVPHNCGPLLPRLCFGVMCLTLGCAEPESVAPETIDSPFLTSTKPEGAFSIAEAVEKLQSEPTRLTLTGRIPGGTVEPFEPNQASFLITELPADGHGEDDPNHADNCPFCKRRAENAPKAIVQIVGQSGEVVPQDAQDVLGLHTGDRVVVEGDATFDAAVNLVTVRAKQLYVER